MRAARAIRARIYDAFIVHMTAAWYRAVLERLSARAHVLDVGIGTGSALLANLDLVTAKDLRIAGIDIDAAYVACCRAELQRRQLDGRIGVCLESIYDHHGGPYDAVYFSGSFMLLPDPAAALRHAATLLAPGGRIYFTQTFEPRRSPWLEIIKPWLRMITTIDFGRVTYEDDFRRVIAAGGFDLDELGEIGGPPGRPAVLAIARST